MKNRKNSHSLSKLQLKRTEYGSNSQRQLNKKHSKRNNQSHIERLGTQNLLQKEHQDAVRKQYYGTHLQGIQMNENDSMISKESQQIKMGKMAFQIQEKMKRVLENGFDTEIDLKNVVLEEQDVDDQDFEEKILQNKHLLKEQRQKKDSTLSQYKPQEEGILKKQSKKFKKLSLMQNKNEKLAQRLKSKSLLPAINPITSKVSQQFQQKHGESQSKNQTERKNLKIQNIYLLPSIKHRNIQQQKPSNNQHNLHLNNQRRLVQLHKNIINKKPNQIKLQSKIQELKNKIAQRTVARQNLRQKQEKHQNPSIHPKVKRYSSHSLFDNIQQFLSNPHQNNSKSQRKFLKLYEKIDDNDDVMEKQKKLLKRKIQLIQNKIKYIEQSPERCVSNETNEKKEDEKEEIVEIPTETGSPPAQQIDDENGTVIWRRMQGNKIEKSNFENEIKYVNSLEQKGRQNLSKYIENQKILHELKMVKRTQEMLSKNQRRLKSQVHFQRPL